MFQVEQTTLIATHWVCGCDRFWVSLGKAGEFLRMKNKKSWEKIFSARAEKKASTRVSCTVCMLVLSFFFFLLLLLFRTHNRRDNNAYISCAPSGKSNSADQGSPRSGITKVGPLLIVHLLLPFLCLCGRNFPSFVDSVCFNVTKAGVHNTTSRPWPWLWWALMVQDGGGTEYLDN